MSAGLNITDDDFRTLVAYIEAFAPVPREHLEELRRDLVTLELDKRHWFIRAGEPTEVLGFVVKGVLRVYFSKPDGTEHVRFFPREGTPVAAYGALLTGRPADVSIQAIEPSRLLTIPYARIVEQYPRHPAWQELGRRVAEHFMLVREAREHDLLMYSAKERYQRLIEHEADLLERVPLYEIASYLGITAESLSRLRAQLGAS